MAEETASADKRSAGTGLAGARLAIVKRTKAVLLLPIVAALLAWAIVVLIPDRYASSVVIQIDPRDKPAPQSDSSAKASAPPAFEAERLAIVKQIEILHSASFLNRAVQALHLADDPEFQTRPLMARIIAPLAKTNPQTVAREALAARLTIERIRSSSLINVRAMSRDAAKAAMIAHVLAAQYIAQERLGTSPEDGAKYPTTEPTASEKVFASLLNKYGFTRTLAGARIVEDAHAPRRPAAPKRGRIVTAVAISTLIFMLALAILLERGRTAADTQCRADARLPAHDVTAFDDAGRHTDIGATRSTDHCRARVPVRRRRSRGLR